MRNRDDRNKYHCFLVVAAFSFARATPSVLAGMPPKSAHSLVPFETWAAQQVDLLARKARERPLSKGTALEQLLNAVRQHSERRQYDMLHWLRSSRSRAMGAEELAVLRRVWATVAARTCCTGTSGDA